MACLKKGHPDLKFYVVGKNPDDRLIQAAKDEPNIFFKGFVEDLEQYYRRSRLCIAPLRFGSGIKVKVLNAMCRGIPTVTTSIGSEGLIAENMKQIAIADSTEQMNNAIHKILTGRQIWEKLKKNSRELIKQHYTWKKLFDSMKKILHKSIIDE